MLRRLNPVPYIRQRISNAYQRKVDSVKTRVDQFSIVPDRFKGTVVEHWAKYWKYLIKDYFTVIFGVFRNAAGKPARSAILAGSGYVVYQLVRYNPTEQELRQQFRHFCNEFGTLPENMQNPVSRHHLITLERLYATGTLRRLNLGVGSIFWKHDNNPDLKTYHANCGYVGPDWLTFPDRIVDVGFMGRLWILSDKMKDYDVNN